MITLVVFHNVNDHDQWKVAFDAHEDVRRAHGAVEHRVYRHATERNRVVVHLYFQDADAARGFMADPSLPVAMEGAGVIGEPWLALFEQTETLSYTPGDAGVTLTVHHTVRDFATWKPVFDEHESVRRSHGALGHRIVRRLDDLNIVVVAIDFP